jgi:hypothetical protein
MNTKLAVGLIVLTAVGTCAVSRHRRHHFEPTKLGDGSILLDTETGVECSARFGMKWSDANKKAVWSAGLAAQNANKEYNTFIQASAKQSPMSEPVLGDELPLPIPMPYDGICTGFSTDEEVKKCNDLFSKTQNTYLEYNTVKAKADKEKVPDHDSSYFQGFPLCKDLR